MQKQRNEVYKKAIWEKIRQRVFEIDHGECVRCNHKVFDSGVPKKITKATVAHHIFEVEKYPEYKYDIYVKIGETTYRNIVSLCRDCHETIHGRNPKAKDGFVNEERCD